MIIRNNIKVINCPVLGVLVFLPRNFLDFWNFLPRSWQLFLVRFARFFKIVERNPRKFLHFLAGKPRLSKILAREPRKILDFLPRKFLDFWHFLPRSWQLFLARFARFWRFFKIVERNPRKFLDFLARKPRLSKILAREPWKACIKVIQDL